VHKLGSAFFLRLQGFRENGKIKCLCYENGTDEPELLVKNGKEWTRQWRSYRGQIKFDMQKERIKLETEK
jgi:hypothetical protein